MYIFNRRRNIISIIFLTYTQISMVDIVRHGKVHIYKLLYKNLVCIYIYIYIYITQQKPRGKQILRISKNFVERTCTLLEDLANIIYWIHFYEFVLDGIIKLGKRALLSSRLCSTHK